MMGSGFLNFRPVLILAYCLISLTGSLLSSGQERSGTTVQHPADSTTSGPKYAGPNVSSSHLITESIGAVSASLLETTETSVRTTKETTDQPVSSTITSISDGTHYEESIMLTTENITDCIQTNRTVNLTSWNVTVLLTLNGSESLYGACLVNISAPANKVLHAQFIEQTCKGRTTSVVTYDSENQEDWDGCETVYDPLSDFTSTDNFVSVQMYLGPQTRNYTLRMVVTAVSSPVKPEIEVRFVTSKLGYVQTPGWNPWALKTYPTWMDSWVQIAVPHSHVVMISFYTMRLYTNFYSEVCSDEVYVYKNSQSPEDLVWSGCGEIEPLPFTVHGVRVLHVHFTSDRWQEEWSGFRMLFSFHTNMNAPEQLASGKWNCSVPQWPEFRPHLLCDLETDCEGGVDEASCPYTDSRCGEGQFLAGDGCYELVRPDGPITWNEANLGCVTRGGRLASLNTIEEWRTVTDVLVHRKLSPPLIGLYTSPAKLPYMYKYTLMWADKTVAYLSTFTRFRDPPACSYTHIVDNQLHAVTYSCNFGYDSFFLCEMGSPSRRGRTSSNHINITESYDKTGSGSSGNVAEDSEIQLVVPTVEITNISTLECPSGHVTHTFMACDAESACWAESHVIIEEGEAMGVPSSSACPAPLTSLPPSFSCASGVSVVPYSVVCDHRDDCPDASDENFCVFPACTANELRCGQTAQCVPQSALCDGLPHCVDLSDEAHCDRFELQYEVLLSPPPAVIDFNGRGTFTVTPLSNYVEENVDAGGMDSGTLEKDEAEDTLEKDEPPLPVSSNDTQRESPSFFNPSVCPETHFQCPGDGYCLPVYVRCNGVYDCPGKEDEAGCNSYTCPGFYRCRGSSACVHPDHVCNGMAECLRGDDELMCDLLCPEGCTCHGLAFFCYRVVQAHEYPELRYLDATGSGMELGHLTANFMLIHVRLARCGLRDLQALSLPNLQSLDLSHNKLQVIRMDHIKALSNLKRLILSGNPLTSLFVDVTISTPPFSSLRLLNLSQVVIPVMDAGVLAPFTNLDTLELTQAQLHTVTEGFGRLPELRVLGLNGCPVSDFPRNVLRDLDRLEDLDTDNYKLCCPGVLPEGFNVQNCHAPVNEISSCDNLYEAMSYRVFSALSACLTITGNAGSLFYRVLISRSGLSSGHEVLLTHLGVSDFLMGVYLGVVGVADALYRDDFLWHDRAWRSSDACITASFLSVLSMIVSFGLIVFITLDRAVVLRLPQIPRLHLHVKSAHIVSGIIWVSGLILALIPVFVSDWQGAGGFPRHLYGHTALCSPLPIPRHSPTGQAYTFVIVVVLILALCLLQAAGLVCTYFSLGSSMSHLLEDKSGADNNSVQNKAASDCVQNKTEDGIILEDKMASDCVQNKAENDKGLPRGSEYEKNTNGKKNVQHRAASDCAQNTRSLMPLLFANFLRCFTLALLVLLSPNDGHDLVELEADVAVFLLPLTSVLNPFLYLAGVIMQHRREAIEEQLLKRVAAKVRGERVKVKVITKSSVMSNRSVRSDDTVSSQAT